MEPWGRLALEAARRAARIRAAKKKAKVAKNPAMTEKKAARAVRKPAKRRG
jgi:hypothetical protein